MRVLVACEFSGIVREAFAKRGHYAMSCDLLPTEIPGNHYRGDVMDIINDDWDLMIAHPPCTYLTYAGVRSWNDPGRCEKRLEALDFFRRLWEAPIKRIAIENPKGCASPTITKYSQVIQPFYFGDKEQKAICLWLKNLKKLEYFDQDDLLGNHKTNVGKPDPSYIKPDGTPRYFTAGINKDRAHNRSRFFPGIAEAMAEQWGNL